MEPMPSRWRQVGWAALLISGFAVAVLLCAMWKPWLQVPIRVVVRYTVAPAGRGVEMRAVVLEDPAELARLWELLRWTTVQRSACGCSPRNFLSAFDRAGNETILHFCGGPQWLSVGSNQLLGTERFYEALRAPLTAQEGCPVGLEARSRDLP